MTPARTLTYSRVVVSGKTLELKLDIHESNSASPSPCIVYFHAGGLSYGDRTSWHPTWLCDDALVRGWRFITVDFRLLPPVHARDIRDDVQAAFRFIAYELPQVDSKHIVVAGTSGGGYPAQLAALYAEPKPAGLLLLYGLGLHFLTPHFLERHTKSFWQGRPILNLDEWRCWLPPACFDEPPLTGYKPEDDHRASLTQFYMQEAVFLDVLFHQVGLGERLRVEGKVALDEETRTLLPELQAATRFPSTFLIHGADDTILLAEDSRLMHERLRGAGIKTALRIVPNAGHAFDYSPDQEEHVRGVLDFFEL